MSFSLELLLLGGRRLTARPVSGSFRTNQRPQRCISARLDVFFKRSDILWTGSLISSSVHIPSASLRNILNQHWARRMRDLLTLTRLRAASHRRKPSRIAYIGRYIVHSFGRIPLPRRLQYHSVHPLACTILTSALSPQES